MDLLFEDGADDNSRQEVIRYIVGNLKEDIYESLISRIGLIVHNAAYVNWNRSYVDMRDSNYVGTQNMIEFATKAKMLKNPLNIREN